MVFQKIFTPLFFTVMKVISVIFFLLTILSAFGGSINPDYLTFPSLLCLALPYFAIITILITVFWAACKKIIFCALGVFTIVICLTPLSDAFPLGGARKPTEGSQKFKIISWNVIHAWDLREKEFPGNRAASYMINSGADVICLAEFRNFTEKEIKDLTPAQKDSLYNTYPYRVGKPHSAIRVMSKYPVSRMEKIRVDFKGETRFDLFEVEFPNSKNLVIAMVHLYSYGLSEQERNVVTEINSVKTAKESMSEFKGSIRQKLRKAFQLRAEDAQELRKVLDEIPKDQPLIVCGDFNDVPASWTYNIVRGDDLRDAYAETNFGPAITYNMHAFYFHIDQMLYRGPLEALDLTIGKIDTSDHYPLIGEFEFK